MYLTVLLTVASQPSSASRLEVQLSEMPVLFLSCCSRSLSDKDQMGECNKAVYSINRDLTLKRIILSRSDMTYCADCA